LRNEWLGVKEKNQNLGGASLEILVESARSDFVVRRAEA